MPQECGAATPTLPFVHDHDGDFGEFMIFPGAYATSHADAVHLPTVVIEDCEHNGDMIDEIAIREVVQLRRGEPFAVVEKAVSMTRRRESG